MNQDKIESVVSGTPQLKGTGFHWAWVILGLCFLNVFTNYSIRLGYGVVLPEMIRDLDFGRAAGGTIYNVYLLTYILLTPFAGICTDRFGARRVITVCGFFLGTGIVLMGFVQNLWTACLAYALSGVGSTGMWAPVITLAQRWFAPQRRGLALGLMSTGYGFGFAVVGLIFPWIVLNLTWRYTWYILGGMALFMVILNGLLTRSDPQKAGYRPWGATTNDNRAIDSSQSHQGIFTKQMLFKDANFWRIGLSYFAISYCLYGITTFMVDYAHNQLGIGLETASMLATVHGIAQVLGVLVILPFSDIVGRKKMIIASNAVIVAAMLGIVFSGSSWLMLCMCVGLLAIFYGATFPMYGACAGDYFPKEIMGTVIGLWTPFYGLGAILTHWVTGLIRDISGVYGLAFSLHAGMAVLALILLPWSEPNKKGLRLERNLC